MSGLIVHEWLAKSGGSERVVQDLIKTYPDADLQVLWDDTDRSSFDRTYETWLAGTPLRRSKAASLLFLPATWRLLQARQRYDWLLISSHLFAHHAKLRRHPTIPKMVYAHTPARYIWEPALDRRGDGVPARLISGALRPLDRHRAQEITSIATNSRFTQERILNSWGRSSQVIYPPVDTERITAVDLWRDTLRDEDKRILDSLPEEYLLGASRFVPYKGLDKVIAAGEATGLPVVIAGSGPGEQRLRARARESTVATEIVVRPSDELLYALYQRSIVYIFPAIEDFGIMPIESMATGTPVIVPNVGGAAESAELTGSGVTIGTTEANQWRRAVDDASRIPRAKVRESSQIFSRGRFRTEISSWMNTHVGSADQ